MDESQNVDSFESTKNNYHSSNFNLSPLISNSSFFNSSNTSSQTYDYQSTTFVNELTIGTLFTNPTSNLLSNSSNNIFNDTLLANKICYYNIINGTDSNDSTNYTCK